VVDSNPNVLAIAFLLIFKNGGEAIHAIDRLKLWSDLLINRFNNAEIDTAPAEIAGQELEHLQALSNGCALQVFINA
jgi:hypothetical protein